MIRLLFFSFFLIACLDAYSQSRVVSGAPTLKDRFPKRSGVFRMSDGNISLGIVFKDTIVTDTLFLLNTDTVAHVVSVSSVGSPCLKVLAGSVSVQPDSAAWFVIVFDASCHPGYGFIMERFSISTDDPKQPSKPFTVTLKLMERFPVMSAEDSLMTQKVRVPAKFMDLGKVKQGIVVKKEFLIHNDGKRDLLIRQLKSDSPSLQVSLSAEVVLPGDSVLVAMELNTAGRTGKESRNFQIYVNDPTQPELRFDIAYTIE